MEKNYKKYLPSKKFIKTMSIILALVIIIFIIFFMSSNGQLFTTKSSNTIKVEPQSFSNLIQDDTDSDNVANWEEALWGTDKNKKMTFGDMPDATYIENKKKELKIEGSINEKGLTETDKFARDFFSSYGALKSSGEVDTTTINNFSNALGQKIVDPNLIDSYSEKDILINNDDSNASKLKYYESIQKLFKNYQPIGIGDELSIISEQLSSRSTDNTTDSVQDTKLSAIANAYKDFAKKVAETSVPKSLVQYHLQIANSSNNTGISVTNLGKISSDPIVGLSGLSQYQKYSDALVKSVGDLETFLSKQ